MNRRNTGPIYPNASKWRKSINTYSQVFILLENRQPNGQHVELLETEFAIFTFFE